MQNYRPNCRAKPKDLLDLQSSRVPARRNPHVIVYFMKNESVTIIHSNSHNMYPIGLQTAWNPHVKSPCIEINNLSISTNIRNTLMYYAFLLICKSFITVYHSFIMHNRSIAQVEFWAFGIALITVGLHWLISETSEWLQIWKHETLAQCCFTVGPSMTLAQHWTNVGPPSLCMPTEEAYSSYSPYNRTLFTRYGRKNLVVSQMNCLITAAACTTWYIWTHCWENIGSILI